MKRTLRRAWVRIRTPDGKLYYHTPISDYFVVQVWREGSSRWRWVAAGFHVTPESPRDYVAPLIAKHGTGQTMNEAQWYAEQWLPPDAPGEQLLWVR